MEMEFPEASPGGGSCLGNVRRGMREQGCAAGGGRHGERRRDQGGRAQGVPRRSRRRVSRRGYPGGEEKGSPRPADSREAPGPGRPLPQDRQPSGEQGHSRTERPTSPDKGVASQGGRGEAESDE